ncbi:alpha-galactosidase [Cnuibacter physcomitrellae]|uniref:alpha-galactosidase n=1 Tax=Cnuibacter physcomitrellae TaxID=1619308 RepID=UPI002175B507|nr:alpha-galactosidase [Cnuibacter physcomitrellae]MCS5497758.1 alpha-galactosidase [Cnuibacter physcomitrellae]
MEKTRMRPSPHRLTHLRAAGVSLVVDIGSDAPAVLHWGRDLGDLSEESLEALRLTDSTARLHNAPDLPRRFALVPGERHDWMGVPGLSGHRGGSATTPRPVLADATVRDDDGRGGEIVLTFADPVSAVTIVQRIAMEPTGIVAVTMSVESTDADAPPYDLASLVAQLPVPGRAGEILDFTGKWSRERHPQRTPVRDGLHAREVRRGKPGVDSPYLMAVGTPGFGSRHGEVWAMHVAWSGDQRWFVERLPEGAGAASSVLGGGELLRPGEIRLGAGEGYVSPTVLFAWSDAGLDGVSERFHERVRGDRRRPGAQPLVLNTWEAVYFDHDVPRLLELVDRAAGIGVERIVLDDGWFRGRRHDRAGLGDWQIDTSVWPDGLGPIVDRVRGHGMQFGLWFEPEMVNLDSDLARTHPDWILGPVAGLGSSSRHQYVLDIAHPAAFSYLLDAISALVERYSIDYLKWDHNRDLVEAVRRTDGEAPGVHTQAVAFYSLLDALRERFPALEIESCASGGGRIDLGVVSRTDRVWTSDCNDPVERQTIQRWSELLLPPELLGSHVGAERSHTTHRSADLSFRLATALFASAGIEWDITLCTDDELAALGRWADLYRETRGLVATGIRVHADLPDDQTLLHGSVAPDRSRALFAWARLATSPAGQSGRVRLPGIDRDATYRVCVRDELGMPALHQGEGPAWFDIARSGGIELPGVVLAEAGVPMPTLDPGQALVLDLTMTSRR